MDGNVRNETSTSGASGSPPSEAWLFAQAILGKPITSPSRAEADARAEREQLEWLAQISPRHEDQLRRLRSTEAEARREREQLEWLATISEEHERKLQTLLWEEVEAKEAQQRCEWFTEDQTAQEAWDPSKHPRQGGPPNAGWWASTGGNGRSGGSSKSPSLLDAIVRRNAAVTELTGIVTPGMIWSNRIASELHSAVRLPGEVARAAASGLGTGGKAVVNGFATAVKSVATLDLNTSQLELIGVTQEDRDRGYDTAVSISTASGQVLIAVGTGGMASALSKGGSIARTASGALVAFDAAGNAVGVVQGVYDATQNGVNIANGAQVAGGLLGLGANAKAARDLSRAAAARKLAEIDRFVEKLPRKNSRTATAADQYEIKHTGPYNYEVSGGGVKFEIDGYRGSTILEAKHVDKPRSSPYVPGSSCPDKVRAQILADARDRLIKARKIIESGATPFKSVEIITNTPRSKKLFEDMLKEINLPGAVRLEP
jgi:hypothetical protein